MRNVSWSAASTPNQSALRLGILTHCCVIDPRHRIRLPRKYLECWVLPLVFAGRQHLSFGFGARDDGHCQKSCVPPGWSLSTAPLPLVTPWVLNLLQTFDLRTNGHGQQVNTHSAVNPFGNRNHTRRSE